MQPQPLLLRASILADGTLKAVFADNSLLLLTPAGTAALHVDGGGCATTVTTQFGLRSLQPKLAGALELRNLHCAHPSLCKAFLHGAPPRPGFAPGVPVTHVRWPASAASARELGLLAADAKGQVQLTAEDRCARLALHPSGLRFSVTWPATPCPAEAPVGGRCTWLVQSFSCGDCPPCWAGPLRLAQAAQLEWCEEVAEQQAPEAAAEHGEPSRGTALTPGERISQLPTPVGSGGGIECCAYPPQSWWLSPTATLCPDLPTVLEWTPEAVWQYLPALQAVEVLIQADQSLCRLDRRGYLHHHLPGAWRSPRTYAPQAVPSWGGCSGARYSLALVASRAAAIRECCVRLYALGKAPTASPLSGGAASLPPAAPAAAQQPAASPGGGGGSSAVGGGEEEIERQVVPGHGTFIALASGLVRISFEDRTLLRLDPSAQRFEVLLPCGRQVSALVAQPAELHAHLAAALEFRAWALRTPVERGVPSARRREVHAELSSTEGQAALCCMELEAGASSGSWGAGSAAHRSSGSWQPAQAVVDNACQVSGSAGVAAAHDAAAPRGRPAAVEGLSLPWVAGGGDGCEQGEEDYMLQLLSSNMLRAVGAEREALVEAWLRRNALLLDQL